MEQRTEGQARIATESVRPIKRARGGTRLAWMLLLFVASALLLHACSDSEGPLPGNVPPLTYLSVQGADLDTLDYRQILHWWGSDPDGTVIGYLIKWDGGWTPPEGAIRWPADTSFVFTTATTDTFTVPTGGDYAERTFVVRALDDQNAPDPTGKTQRFKVRNWIPELNWSGAITLPDSSLPAVTFAWSPRDLDGRQSVRRFRYWLDGADSTAAPIVSDTLVALVPEDFEGRFGVRTVKAQAFDESLAPSNVISHTWTVREPTGEYLLIDNVSNDVPGFAREDAFFRAVLDSVAPGNYFVYDVKTRGGFRSAQEVYPLLSFFKGVVWYSGLPNVGNDASMLANLKLAESGLSRYLDDGGRVLIAATNAVGNNAGLSVAFARARFGVDDFFHVAGRNDISLPRFSGFDIDFVATADTLGNGTTVVSADFVLASEGTEGLFKLRENLPTLSGALPDPEGKDAWIGLLREAGAGRAVLLTLPLSLANRPSAGDPPVPLVNKYGAALLRRLFGL